MKTSSGGIMLLILEPPFRGNHASVNTIDPPGESLILWTEFLLYCNHYSHCGRNILKNSYGHIQKYRHIQRQTDTYRNTDTYRHTQTHTDTYKHIQTLRHIQTHPAHSIKVCAEDCLCRYRYRVLA